MNCDAQKETVPSAVNVNMVMHVNNVKQLTCYQTKN